MPVGKIIMPVADIIMPVGKIIMPVATKNAIIMLVKSW